MSWFQRLLGWFPRNGQKEAAGPPERTLRELPDSEQYEASLSQFQQAADRHERSSRKANTLINSDTDRMKQFAEDCEQIEEEIQHGRA